MGKVHECHASSLSEIKRYYKKPKGGERSWNPKGKWRPRAGKETWDNHAISSNLCARRSRERLSGPFGPN